MTSNEDEIVLSGDTISKVYDGTPLEAEVTVSGLPDDFTYEAEAEGSQTSVDSSVDSYRILDGKEKDVTEYFTGIPTETGTLTVTAAYVAVTTGSAEKPYDGLPLTTPVAITGLVGDDASLVTVAATGSQTNAGPGENPVSSYTIFNTAGQDAPLGFTSVTTVSGALTVTPLPVTITLSNASKVLPGRRFLESKLIPTGRPPFLTISYIASVVSYTLLGKQSVSQPSVISPWFASMDPSIPLMRLIRSSCWKVCPASSRSRSNSSVGIRMQSLMAHGTASAFCFSASPSGVSLRNNSRSLLSGLIRSINPRFSNRFNSGASVPDSR